MRLLVTLILLFLFRSTYSAFQCYQCTHNEIDQNVDCINADLKYLQNCTNDNQANDMKQVTDWSCSLRFNITPTTLLAVARECIPRIFLSACTSTGNSFESFVTCVCDTDACNYSVLEFPNDTTTTTVETTTTGQTTAAVDNGNGSGNGSIHLKLSSILVTYYFLVCNLICAFQFY